MTRGLEGAATAPERVQWLGHNHTLWSLLVKDLANAGNQLPVALKAQLLQLGAWSMRYSTLAVLKELPLDPLIDVNRNVAEGLAQQAAMAHMPPPAASGVTVLSA